MAALTTEQIEKKQQLKQLVEEIKQLKSELVEAGAWPLEENELDNVAGGCEKFDISAVEYQKPKTLEPEQPDLTSILNFLNN